MATTFSNLDPVVLNPPIVPNEEFELPDNLETVDEVVGIARDCYNSLSGLASKVGLEFPKFPDGDVFEWIIEPFTGNFNEIAAGGGAAYNAGQGLQSISHNIAFNNTKLVGAWTGGASESFALTTALYAGVAQAAGFLLKQSQPIFEGIGAVSKAAGELLAGLIGDLVELCVSMVDFLVKKFSGAMASIGSWILDALSGFQDVRDLVSNVKEAYDSLMRILGFKDEALAYYETAKACFGVFEELQTLASYLPTLVSDPLHQGDELTERLRRMEAALEKKDKKIAAAQDTIDGRAQDGTTQAAHDWGSP